MNIKNAAGIVLLVISPFILLELVFRALPVSYPPHVMPVSEERPVARHEPDRRYRYSKGWNFAIRAEKYSNNYGYINENDYDPDAREPLMMVIGDSYVVAHQVDAGKSAAELLHSRVEPEGRVYSIALSGAPLSQYLVFADYARTTFRPDSMAFIIISNDFDESLLKYNALATRFHLFREEGDELVLERIDYSLSTAKSLLRKSAFIRYVMLNLEVKAALERLMIRESKREYVGNVPKTVDPTRIDDSHKAIDAFFDQLPALSGLDAADIVFAIDGMRPALYSEEHLREAESSYFAQMRRYFSERARTLGYEVIDMQPVFIRQHELDDSEFEYETDAHWNELGNKLVADEIARSRVFRTTFPKRRK